MGANEMKHKQVLIAVAIPFILLCLLIARAEYHVRSGEQWNFEITAYDPRDLLRGHYLQFSLVYDWETNKNACSNGQSCCMCLTRTEKKAPKVHKTSCDTAKSQCDGFMLSEHQNTLNRFYISETEARRAEEILQQAQSDNNAYLTVSINKKGEPKIVDLLIGEQPINDILNLN
jgi:uncharacterized membrane-anchored protein